MMLSHQGKRLTRWILTGPVRFIPGVLRDFGIAMGRLVVVIGLGSMVGCLYTDPVNMPPRVEIDAPDVIWRKQMVTFTARPSDPNGDAVTVEWGRTFCSSAGPAGGGPCRPCPTGPNEYLDPSRWPVGRVTQTDFVIPATNNDQPSCIWAFAVDHPHGATAPAIPYAVIPQNHPPVPTIELVSTNVVTGGTALRLANEIELSAAGSTDADGDLPMFDWTFDRVPAASAVNESNLKPCSDPRDRNASWCFVPDVPGTYQVRLVARDGFEQSNPDPGALATTTKTLEVASQLPCLTGWSPEPDVILYDPSNPRLEVRTVEDDLDFFPGEVGLHFRWSVGPPAGGLTFVGNDLPRFELSDRTPGDVIRVRVEVVDRNVTAVEAALARCDDDQDTCFGSPGCNQRFTWTVRY